MDAPLPKEHRAGIDWLSFSIPIGNGDFAAEEEKGLLECGRALSILGAAGAFKTARPHYGYRRARLSDGGALVLWGGSREMGIAASVPGGALCGDILGGIRAVREAGGSIGRIDVAIDAGAECPFSLITKMLRDGRCATRARRWCRMESSSGATVYVGSFKSEKLLRIYDKALQLQLGKDTPWTRIELQLRDDAAEAAASALLKQGMGIIPGLIREFFHVDEGWWHDLVPDGEIPAAASPVLRRDGHRKWIERVALPSVIREAEVDPEFREKVEKALLQEEH